jgi:hypothetical protein
LQVGERVVTGAAFGLGQGAARRLFAAFGRFALAAPVAAALAREVGDGDGDFAVVAVDEVLPQSLGEVWSWRSTSPLLAARCTCRLAALVAHHDLDAPELRRVETDHGLLGARTDLHLQPLASASFRAGRHCAGSAPRSARTSGPTRRENAAVGVGRGQGHRAAVRGAGRRRRDSRGFLGALADARERGREVRRGARGGRACAMSAPELGVRSPT